MGTVKKNLGVDHRRPAYRPLHEQVLEEMKNPPPDKAEVVLDQGDEYELISPANAQAASAAPTLSGPQQALVDQIRGASDLGSALKMIEGSSILATQLGGRASLVEQTIDDYEKKAIDAGSRSMIFSRGAEYFGTEATLFAEPRGSKVKLALKRRDLYASGNCYTNQWVVHPVIKQQNVSTGFLGSTRFKAGPADVQSAFTEMSPATLADAVARMFG